MKVRFVHLLLDGRSKVIPIPEGGDLEIKVETDAGLLNVRLPRDPSRSTKALRVATTRRKKKDEKNLVKARSATVVKNDEYREVERGFYARLSPPQLHLANVLFDRLGFVSTVHKETWSPRLGWWIGLLLVVCPEPWRLDWAFIRDWLSNSSAISNKSRTRDGKSPIGPRRGTARNMFRDAWSEQVGPISVPADVSALRQARTRKDVEGDHPFAVVYTAIQDGSLTRASGVLEKMKQYREADAITDDELRQAREMVDGGVWLGDLSIPGA